MIGECFAIVTSNDTIRNSYLDVMKTIKIAEDESVVN
jgi:hypothetical protein